MKPSRRAVSCRTPSYSPTAGSFFSTVHRQVRLGTETCVLFYCSILFPALRIRHIVLINYSLFPITAKKNTQFKDQVGQSNADNPAFQGVLYDPTAPAGSRFSQTDLPTSSIPRMYHSTATLTPNGTIMIAGSNPNVDVTTVKYATEYRVEWLSPSYLNQPRPTYTGLPATIDYGSMFTLQITLPPSATTATGKCLHLISFPLIFDSYGLFC